MMPFRVADGRITFAHEPAGLETTWQALANRSTASPKLWMDAWLAGSPSGPGFE
jgi:hypothetical protein